MLIQAFLRGLVVIGRDREDGVGAESLIAVNFLDHFARVVSARPCDYSDAAFRFFNRQFNDASLFVVAHRYALASGAAGDDEVNAVFDLKLDEAAKGRFVN